MSHLLTVIFCVVIFFLAESRSIAAEDPSSDHMSLGSFPPSEEATNNTNSVEDAEAVEVTKAEDATQNGGASHGKEVPEDREVPLGAAKNVESKKASETTKALEAAKAPEATNASEATKAKDTSETEETSNSSEALGDTTENAEATKDTEAEKAPNSSEAAAQVPLCEIWQRILQEVAPQNNGVVFSSPQRGGVSRRRVAVTKAAREWIRVYVARLISSSQDAQERERHFKVTVFIFPEIKY